jgi:hypothetical protein
VIRAGSIIVIFVNIQRLRHQGNIFMVAGSSTNACMIGRIRSICRPVYPIFEIARSRKSISITLIIDNRLQDKVSDPSTGNPILFRSKSVPAKYIDIGTCKDKGRRQPINLSG